MEHKLALDTLFDRADIWLGRTTRQASATRDTGFTELNALLVGGGWPLDGLVEINAPRLGSGEWQLLSGTLQHFAEREGYLVLVNPPAMLCASALAQMGVPLDRVLVVRTANRRELMLGVVESLRSRCAQMVLLWEERERLGYAELRKLQLAAADSRTLCFMLRLGATSTLASPASLRVQLQSRFSGMQLHILRQRGGLIDRQVELPWPAGWTLQPFDAVAMPQQTKGRVLAFQAQG